MGKSLTRKIIESHFVSGDMTPGKEIFIKVDQTLTHDINAVMTYLAFEAIGLDRVRTECSVSYLDHNLLYVDNKTPDDHIYLIRSKEIRRVCVQTGQRHLPYRSCIPFWCARQGIDGRRQSHTAWRRDRYAVYRCRRHGYSNRDDGCSDASDDAESRPCQPDR